MPKRSGVVIYTDDRRKPPVEWWMQSRATLEKHDWPDFCTESCQRPAGWAPWAVCLKHN